MSLLSILIRLLPPTPNAAEWPLPSSVAIAATNPAITCRFATSSPPAIVATTLRYMRTNVREPNL
jgi:hypothetical protein